MRNENGFLGQGVSELCRLEIAVKFLALGIGGCGSKVFLWSGVVQI